MRYHATLLVRCFAVVDTILLAVLLVKVWWPPFGSAFADLLLTVLITPFWLALFRFFGIYESHRIEGIKGLARGVASAQLIGGCVLLLAVLVIRDFHRLPAVGWFIGLSTVLLLAERAVGYRLAHAIRSRGYDTRNVCVIGNWDTAQAMQERFEKNREWGLRITCVGSGRPHERQYLSYPERALLALDLDEVLRLNVIDEVLIAVSTEEFAAEQVTVSLCEQYGIVARVLLQPSGRELTQARLEQFCGEMSIAMGGVRLDGVHAAWKRVTDVAIALAMLVLFSPLILVAAVLVKLSSAGPVFFRQRRAGLHARPFTMYKFRTMFKGSEALVHSLAKRSVTGGPAFKDPRDTRLTPTGRLLRRFSIDEFPQLVNVLRGDMSMVGPRPLPMHEAMSIIGEARRRFSVRPGLTCLWQVSGRSEVEFSRWMKYDLEYVDSWSPWLDLRLLLRSVPAVLSGKGAY
jgi:exopolysaccharide biosynthesis polyprenyl glycosylphosphotransferase